MESGKVKEAIVNVLKRLDISCVDDETYKRLVNVGSQYDYVEYDLLEQMIEAELIEMLYQSYWPLGFIELILVLKEY